MNYNPVRTSAILTILIMFNVVAFAASSAWIDSAENRYVVAARDYNKDALQETVVFITNKPDNEQSSPRALLLQGLIYWHLQLIAYCQNTSNEVSHYGKLAIETLNKSEKAGADIYMTASHKALASQLLAGQGISKGALYGPRAATELKKAKEAQPTGYYSRLLEAINANQAPSFAGGNPKKAVEMLEKMVADFPDSIDVKIHLSDAYIKVNKKDDARRLIVPIIKKYPLN